MASRSMHLLRKYQKTVLVVMGVILMVTFTVGTSLSYLTDRTARGGHVDPIAVTWTKGVVRENELHHLRSLHNATRAFLAAVINETLQRGGRPVVGGQVIFDERMFSQVGVGIPMDDSDPTLINTMLMAEEAKQMGIVVDRAAVKAHLKQLSSPELAEGDWAELLGNVLAGLGERSPIGPDDVLDHLAYELRAQHARMLATAGMESLPPGQVWECFNRLNRRVSIEAFPIEVAAFVSQVKGEPTTAEIQKLFDEGRFRDPNPNTHEPGFRKPHKVAFEYAIVKFEPFLEEAKKKVTDDEIKKQYDLDIAQGKHKVLDLPSATPGETPKTPETPATPMKEGEKPADAKPGETKPEDAKPADAKPGDAKAGDAKPDAKPGDAKAPETKPAENKPADPPAPECQETTAQPPAKTAEKSAADKPAAAQPPADKPAEAKPAEGKPAEAKPGETPPAGDKPSSEKPAGDKPATETPKEQKFKPLEDVKEDIRKELAQPIARKARDAAVEELTKAIDAYGNAYRRWVTKKEALKEKVDPKSDPGKFDLAKAAGKHSFPIATVPLVDHFEVVKYEIGKMVSSFDFSGGRLQMLTFADVAFGQDEPLFTAREANSTDPDVNYIYFRTAEEMGGEVTLAEARPKIIDAWKHQKAFELALEDARQKAAKAKSAASLREAIVDPAKLLTPAPFSWLTTNSLAFGFGAPEPSRVNGIDLTGREFMQAVFALSPGETGVAPNQAHSQVYVVRLISQTPDEKQLRAEFMESGGTPQVLMVAREELMQTAMDWYRGLEERYQVKWQRPPYNPRRRA